MATQLTRVVFTHLSVSLDLALCTCESIFTNRRQGGAVHKEKLAIQAFLSFGAVATLWATFRQWQLPRVEVWLALLILLGGLGATFFSLKLRKKNARPLKLAVGVTLSSLFSIYGALRLDMHLGIAANGALVALTWGLLVANPRLAHWVVQTSLINTAIQCWIVPAYLYFR
jgi:hypothetical protein